MRCPVWRRRPDYSSCNLTIIWAPKSAARRVDGHQEHAALLARAPNAGLEWFFFASSSKTQDAVHRDKEQLVRIGRGITRRKKDRHGGPGYDSGASADEA